MFSVAVFCKAHRQLAVKLSPTDVGILKWDGVILSTSLPSSRICHAGKAPACHASGLLEGAIPSSQQHLSQATILCATCSLSRSFQPKLATCAFASCFSQMASTAGETGINNGS